MFDLALNRHFSVYLDDQNDLDTVTGRDEFEQSITVALTRYLHSAVVGELDTETTLRKLRVRVQRAAQEHGRIQDIEEIRVRESPDDPNTYQLRIVYQATSDFILEVSE